MSILDISLILFRRTVLNFLVLNQVFVFNYKWHFGLSFWTGIKN